MKQPINVSNDNDKINLESASPSYLCQGAVSMVSGASANLMTTPLYAAWRKKQLTPNVSTVQIFRSMITLAGAKEVSLLAKEMFPMYLRHALGFFTVVNTSMLYLEKKPYSGFTKGCIAGGLSAITETLLTAVTFWRTVMIIDKNDISQTQYSQLQLMRFYMGSYHNKSNAEKEHLKLAIQRYRRAFNVTLLKNGVANTLTIAFTHGFKDILDERNPGCVYNPVLAAFISPVIASQFFMPFVVLETKTLANIDKSIWKNLKNLLQENKLKILWSGGVLRPIQKGTALALSYIIAKTINKINDECFVASP